MSAASKSSPAAAARIPAGDEAETISSPATLSSRRSASRTSGWSSAMGSCGERAGHHGTGRRAGQVAGGEGDFQVLGDGELVEEMELLEDETDVALSELGADLGRELVHRLAEKVVLALEGAVEHAEDGEQRRL